MTVYFPTIAAASITHAVMVDVALDDADVAEAALARALERKRERRREAV